MNNQNSGQNQILNNDSETQRNGESIYNKHRITNINIADVQQNKERYRISKSETPIPRCKQERKVKYRGKIPLDIEYENNKQKMKLPITERNDITPLIGMDWLKKFRLTIGNIRLDENSQSEKKTDRREMLGLFQKQYNNKRCQNTHTIEIGTISGKRKSKTNPSPFTRSSRNEIERLTEPGHSERVKQVDETCFV